MRAERDWSPSVLSRMTPTVGDQGIGEKTISAIERNPGRVPEARVIRALARAFEVDEATFYEWPIAQAREAANATPEAARQREADALRKRAQRQIERREGEPDTSPVPRRLKGQAP